jgi:ribosomal protein L5
MAEKNKDENVMRGIEIDKVVINCSVGEAGDKILKACKVLKVIYPNFSH